METTTVYESNATMYGWGSDLWKGVRGLSDEDLASFRAGALVVLTGGRPAYGTHGTTLRCLAKTGDRWGHRLMTPEQLAAAHAAGLTD